MTNPNATEGTRAVTRYWRECVLVLVPIALFSCIMAAAPIPQDPAYHQFADRRTVLGVPNFFNVASNIAFLVAGIAGAALWLGRRGPPPSASWAVVFLGAALVSVGSGYYHWAPDNASLVWDRLPMTISFMGLFAALLSEHINERLERGLLLSALAVGATSVAWWHYADDLRVYLWVQLTPLVTILLVLAMFPGRYTRRNYLLYGLGCYALAKVAEFWDSEIFTLTANTVSGHSLKHLLAASGLFFIYLMLRWRKPILASPPSPPNDTRVMGQSGKSRF